MRRRSLFACLAGAPAAPAAQKAPAAAGVTSVVVPGTIRWGLRVEF